MRSLNSIDLTSWINASNVVAVCKYVHRGNRREAIFLSDKDRALFIETLAEACEKTDWQVHSWCLMSNHFHLVTETPRATWSMGCSGS